MKAIVGFAFFLLFLAGIAFVMLQGRQMANLGPSGGGAAITGISWRPTFVGPESVPDDSGMFVRFEVDGSITGDGGCNGFFGTLKQTDSDIEVAGLGATRKACDEAIMRRETAFIEAIGKTKGFISTKEKLRLLDGENNGVAEFVVN